MHSRIVYKTDNINTNSINTCNIPINKSIEARRMMILAYNNILFDLKKDNTICDDIISLHKAIKSFFEGSTIINVAESGTAMRLLTSFIAIKTKTKVRLEGTARQHQRPISSLVNALRLIGADIKYIENEGYPPLEILPMIDTDNIPKATIIDCSLSSQYLSSLLIAFSHLPIGSKIQVTDKIVSSDYITMTLKCLEREGVIYSINNNIYTLESIKSLEQTINREYDYSAISFIYEIVSLMPLGYKVLLPKVKYSNIQGDCKATIDSYKRIGIKTTFDDNGLTISKMDCNINNIEIDMSCSPDLVPAFVCSLLGNNIAFKIKGISHLEIKESNRIEAIITETEKLGYTLKYTDGSLLYDNVKKNIKSLDIIINSHHDHRIAMSLAPLVSIKHDRAIIIDSEVVQKSFPTYWSEIEKLGIKNKEI